MTRKEIASYARQVLKENEVINVLRNGPSEIYVPVQGKAGGWNCILDALDGDRLAVYSYLPVAIPAGREGAALDFVTRANLGLLPGAFELDPEEGMVRLRSVTFLTGSDADEVLVFRTFDDHNACFGTYLPGLVRVLYSAVDPARAVAEIESPEVAGLFEEVDHLCDPRPGPDAGAA